MEEFYGKRYQMVSSEKYEQMLKYLGIGFFRRQMALALRPVQFLVRNEDRTFTLHFSSTLVNYQFNFIPREEFYETKPDGVKVRSLLTIEGNKLYHSQVEANGRTLNHVYEFFADKMIITSTAPGLEDTVKRNHIAVH